MDRLKRKSYIIGLGAAVLVLALVALQFARPSRAESPRLERFLPAETVGFVQVNDLRAQALKVIESEAWREFSRENAAASTLFMMAVNHAGALDASYAVALVGAGAEGPQFVITAEFEDSSARRTFENRVLGLVRRGNEQGITTRTEQHGEVTIHTVAPEGRKGFAYAREDTMIVFSNTPDVVRRVLDVRAGKAPSLETNQTFAQARARARYTDGMFGYLDGAALARLVESAPAGDARKGADAFRHLFRGVGADSVQSVAFTSTFEDGRVAERFVVVTPERRGVLGTVGSNPPTSQALLALVPADALQAFDASIAHAPQTFEQMLALVGEAAAQAGGPKGPADALAEFTAKTGVSLREDVVGLLGSEVCFAQLRTDDGRAGVVILSVRDEQAFAQMLEKFAAHHKGAVSARDYKGVAVRTITGEKGPRLEYAFVGGNFVASGDVGVVERVIETAQGAPSLRAGAAYQSASAGLSGQPQFVYFSTNADYLNRLGRMLKEGGQKEAKSEGLSAALRPSFAFGVAQPDGFYVESRTPLGTFPRLLTSVTARLGESGALKEGAE